MGKSLLYAELSKGFVFKTLIDFLSPIYQRPCFLINKDGFFHRDASEPKSEYYGMMTDVEFWGDRFKKYKCLEKREFTVNGKQLHKLVKTVKKKDTLILSIDSDARNKLIIKIKPDGGSNKSNRPVETSEITIQDVSQDIELTVPEGYSRPVVIDSSSLQRIKKITSSSKNITVKIQSGNYLRFYGDSGELYSTDLEFGTLETEDVEDDNGDDEDGNSDNIEDGDTEGGDDEDGDTEGGDEDGDDEGGEDDDITKEDLSIYERPFKSEMINLTIKLPGLCKQIQFCSPPDIGYPLLIECPVDALGNVRVFIKDHDMIEFEKNSQE